MKKSFKLLINPQTFEDIQNAIAYYNQKQKGLGKRFLADIKQDFNSIRKNYGFQIRYDNIRCLTVKKFPFMIHYSIDDNVINVRAVIHTSKNPSEHWVNK